MPSSQIDIADGVAAGGASPLLVIAGPDVIEGEEHALRMARALGAACRERGVPLVFKASFDKANRTSVDSPRGPGLALGLRVLAAVKRETGLPVTTDFHEPSQAEALAEVVDLLQVPAFLCRQTDLLVAAAKTGKAVNVKKGQFLAPENMQPLVEKLVGSGCRDILLTERGVTFGYGHLVVDFRALPVMRRLGHPVVFDGTHSVQRPGGLGTKSGGDRTEVPALVRAAAAVGVDGLFLEVHEDPDKAPSDGPNMLVLSTLAPLLDTVRRVREAAGEPR